LDLARTVILSNDGAIGSVAAVWATLLYINERRMEMDAAPSCPRPLLPPCPVRRPGLWIPRGTQREVRPSVYEAPAGGQKGPVGRGPGPDCRWAGG